MADRLTDSNPQDNNRAMYLIAGIIIVAFIIGLLFMNGRASRGDYGAYKGANTMSGAEPDTVPTDGALRDSSPSTPPTNSQ